MEAGLRSFDRSMPEEVNRVLTDALCDFLFVTERDAVDNLLREGIARDKIYLVGNTMVDTLLRHREQAQNSEILSSLGLTRNGEGPNAVLPYATTTLHRPSNVDDRQVFGNILDALAAVGERLPVFFPVHPRTLNRIREFGYQAYFDFSKFDAAFERSRFSVDRLAASARHCYPSDHRAQTPRLRGFSLLDGQRKASFDRFRRHPGRNDDVRRALRHGAGEHGASSYHYAWHERSGGHIDRGYSSPLFE